MAAASLSRAAGLSLAALALTAFGCSERESPRLDVEVVRGDVVAPLEDLAVFLRIGDGAGRRVGADVFRLRQAGVDLAEEASVVVGLRVPGGIEGDVTVYVVGCGVPARCTNDPVTGPDCRCDEPLAFGALRVRVQGPTRKGLRLWPFDGPCDGDGDLLVDCRRIGPEGACCRNLGAEVARFVSDCHDAPPGAECVGRGCDPRAAHPFRPAEPSAAAVAGERAGVVVERHVRWCGDGLDNDCAGGDEPCRAIDADGDGYPAGIDCDDENPDIHPGRPEVCGDAVDDDCDGVAPDCDADGDGVYAEQDCDDNDPERYPGRPEICGDGIDQDCNGHDAPCLDDDLDGDGFDCPADAAGAPHRCAGPGLDCDDLDAGIYPGAPERCGDGIDQDCDGVDPPCAEGDADGDGVLSVAAGGTDCDDGDPRVYPGAPERCGDGIDQDCDGRDLPCAGVVDADGDGWSPPADCDDTDPEVHPGAPEWCNARDDDCDGHIDEGNPLRTGADEAAPPAECGDVCPEGGGAPCPCRRAPRVCRNDRSDPSVGAFVLCLGVAAGDLAEQCNGIDDDCDGEIDEFDRGRPLERRCYDGPPGTEGVGACLAGVATCVAPPGAGEAHWGPCEGQRLPAAEDCNGVDDDCDGVVDRGPGGPLSRPCYDLPQGEPGVGICRAGTQTCRADDPVPAWGVCLDAVGPAEEVCNDVDDDCDGTRDEGPDGAPLRRDCYTGPEWTLGIGICRGGTAECVAGVFGECRGQVLPAAAEVCDGRDEDCDTRIDEDATDVGGPCEAGLGACRRPGVTVCRDGREVCGALPGSPTVELCNGVDDDCDGVVDNRPVDVGGPCAVGEGACRRTGTFVCRDGQRVCDAVAGAPTAESCNGVDDDCDGRVDEQLTRRCGSDIGQCRSGEQTCAHGIWGLCVGEVLPRPETCNGLDDDCDQETDEQATDAGAPCDVGEGACRTLGSMVCRGGALVCEGTPGEPQPEICDGRDNDCDGRTDEGDAGCGPTGDRCVNLGCRCGNGPKCDDGRRCVDGVCRGG